MPSSGKGAAFCTLADLNSHRHRLQVGGCDGGKPEAAGGALLDESPTIWHGPVLHHAGRVVKVGRPCIFTASERLADAAHEAKRIATRETLATLAASQGVV